MPALPCSTGWLAEGHPEQLPWLPFNRLTVVRLEGKKGMVSEGHGQRSPMSWWAWVSTRWPCRPYTSRSLSGNNIWLSIAITLPCVLTGLESSKIIESREGQNEILELVSWAARGWDVTEECDHRKTAWSLLRNLALPKWPGTVLCQKPAAPASLPEHLSSVVMFTDPRLAGKGRN